MHIYVCICDHSCLCVLMLILSASLVWSEKSTDSVPVKHSHSLASTVKKSNSEVTSNSVAVIGRTEDLSIRHALTSPLDAPQPPNSTSVSEWSRSSERNSANPSIKQSQENLNTDSQDDSIVIDPEDTTKPTTQDPTLALIEQNHLQTRSEEGIYIANMTHISGLHMYEITTSSIYSSDPNVLDPLWDTHFQSPSSRWFVPFGEVRYHIVWMGISWLHSSPRRCLHNCKLRCSLCLDSARTFLPS